MPTHLRHIALTIFIFSFSLVFCLCVAKIIVQNNTTRLGYRIADLKRQEAYQLKRRSALTLFRTHLTTKESLERILTEDKSLPTKEP